MQHPELASSTQYLSSVDCQHCSLPHRSSKTKQSGTLPCVATRECTEAPTALPARLRCKLLNSVNDTAPTGARLSSAYRLESAVSRNGSNPPRLRTGALVTTQADDAHRCNAPRCKADLSCGIACFEKPHGPHPCFAGPGRPLLVSRAGCFAGLLLGPARGAHAQLSSRGAPHTGQTAARCSMLCCPVTNHTACLSAARMHSTEICDVF